VSIPLVDVRAQYAPFFAELTDRLVEVLESGRFILGPNVEAFEREAAAFLDVPDTVAVANGTDALVLVLEALGVGPGDEVICPAFTFFATAEAVARRGATPVFCDVERESLNLDPADVAARVGPRTKAILVVHLFGRPMSLNELPDGVLVLEDTAQAFGATLGETRAGTLGKAGTFSFFPTKNLPGLGDGGLVATVDPELAERIRLLRFHGSRDKKTFELVGTNSRLDAVQAAMLRVFLPRLTGWNDARRDAAARYAQLGLGDAVELPADEPGHVYHVFAVRTPHRAAIATALREAGIASASYYTTPLHLQPALSYLGVTEGSLPETERAAAENLALPMWGGIAPDQQERVVEAVRAAVGVPA
jgi:dTDP-4-amino-4,6-dideoxygalactose transaminase